MDSKNLQDYRVVDLKKELDLRGLPKSGSKKDLVDRLKAHMEMEELREKSAGGGGGATIAGAQVPLELVEDGQNEFVKNYLQQREKLLSQQMEQKKRYEEETSRSQSECETEDQSSPERRVLSRQNESSVVAAVNEDSGDSTDVDTPAEAENDLAGQSQGSEVHAAEARPVAVNVSEHHEPEPPTLQSHSSVMLPVASPGDHNEQPPTITDDPQSEQSASKPAEEDEERQLEGDRSMLRSPEKQQEEARSLSGSPEKQQEGDRSVLRPPERGRRRSSSGSSTSPHRSASRSPSRSLSAHSERSSNSRSSSRSPTRSRSSSEEPMQQMHDDRVTNEESRSRSSSPHGKLSSFSAIHHAENTTDVSNSEVVQPVELMVEESQQSMDSRHDIISDASAKEEHSIASMVGSKEKDLVNNSSSSVKPVSDVGDLFTAAKPVRKRKWGSVNVPEAKTINISTDSLKGLGLEISAEALAAENLMEVEEAVAADTESKDLPSPKGQIAEDKLDKDTRASKIRRIVYQDLVVPEVGSGDAERKVVTEVQDDSKNDIDTGSVKQDTSENSANTGASNEPAKVGRTVSLKSTDRSVIARSVSLTVEDPVDTGRRSPSPPRRPPSNVVHVTGLVRPYTLGQLKELLGRTGTLVPDGFWIDSIKSHCYVTYETVEQAVATRQALHGKRWPASNPKMLGVEFRTTDEVEFRKKNCADGVVAPRGAKRLSEQALADVVKAADKQQPNRERPEPSKDTAKVAPDSNKSSAKDSVEKSAPRPVREWDRNKPRLSRSRSKDRRLAENKTKVDRDRKESERRDRSRDDRRRRGRSDKPGAAPKVEEEPPAKLLDDLFRKTKSTPCIYWLPLTDDQVAEKMAQEKERLARKEQLRLEREKQMEADRQIRQKAREEREQARESERNARLQSRRKIPSGGTKRLGLNSSD